MIKTKPLVNTIFSLNTTKALWVFTFISYFSNTNDYSKGIGFHSATFSTHNFLYILMSVAIVYPLLFHYKSFQRKGAQQSIMICLGLLAALSAAIMIFGDQLLMGKGWISAHQAMRPMFSGAYAMLENWSYLIFSLPICLWPVSSGDISYKP